MARSVESGAGGAAQAAEAQTRIAAIANVNLFIKNTVVQCSPLWVALSARYAN